MAGRKLQFGISFCLFFIPMALRAELPSARNLASKMKIGWNLGNTLEVTWADPGTTTQAAIDSVKAAGFTTVRLPVAWFYHADTTTSSIDANWFVSVKKVVDFCIRDSMYVIIHAHWDHGWLENRITAGDKNDLMGRQVASVVKSSMSLGSSLKSNMYIVRMYGTNGIKSYKLLKKQ